MDQNYEERRWWLVRHAPVPASVVHGHLDLPADFADKDRIAALADLLPLESSFISSDLVRCRDTARHLLKHREMTDYSFNERAMLREQNFGDWEGRAYSEIEAADPGQYRAFFESPAEATPNGGESFVDVTHRVNVEIGSLLQSAEGPDIVVITHAGVIRAIVGHALGMTPEKMLSLAIDPLSLTRLTSFTTGADTSWRVDFMNDLGRTRLSPP